jgi:hypothetical protein
MTDILSGLGSWWNGLGPIDNDLPREVERAKAAALDYVVIKYGHPDVEQAFSGAGIRWGTERFVYANDPVGEATMLANAVDAGAAFAVINAEDGGGFDASQAAGDAATALIDAFRARHADTPLYACIDTRGVRQTSPYEQVLLTRCDGLMPMVYPLDFYPSRPADYVHTGVSDALAPLLGTFVGGHVVKQHPVLQAYGGIGGNDILEEVRQAAPYAPASLSFYTIGHATDDEWQQVVNLRRLVQARQAQGYQTLIAVAAAFARVGQAIAAGQSSASIAKADRDIVKYIAVLL